MEKDGKRVFDLISFYDATRLLKEEFNQILDKQKFDKEQVFKRYFEKENRAKFLFTLKQGDPVYMLSKDEDIITDKDSPLYESFWKDKIARSRNIYYVTKFSGNEIYFMNHIVANPIIKKKEFGSQDAYQKIEGLSIKNYCIKLKIDRLGNIEPY